MFGSPQLLDKIHQFLVLSVELLNLCTVFAHVLLQQLVLLFQNLIVNLELLELFRGLHESVHLLHVLDLVLVCLFELVGQFYIGLLQLLTHFLELLLLIFEGVVLVVVLVQFLVQFNNLLALRLCMSL